MCTLLLAFRQHPRYPLILAANRDEFYDRETAPAAFWEDAPELFAGRDLMRGGTWLGVTTSGRIAALTNYRDPHAHRPEAPTRGHLVSGYLGGGNGPEEYLQRVRGNPVAYSGYNLIVGDPDRLFYHSNKSDELRPLEPGVYGLSNHLLNTPWPKVERGREALARLLPREDIAAEDLFAILADETKAPDEALPDTGVGLEWERLLSSIFIKSERYGTRSSTVILIDAGRQATFIERDFDRGGRDTRQTFDWAE